MKRLALIFFVAAAALTWLAVKAGSTVKRKRLAAAAVICWGVVVLGFLV